VSVELLRDMIKVHEQEGDPLGFDDQTVELVKNWWLPIEKAELPGMQIQLYPAGHVAGAAMTGIRSEGKSILYTGDFSLHSTEILDGCNLDVLPHEPDVLISESTYGGTIRQPRNELSDKLLAEAADTLRHRGSVLIPTFAFHRSQEMAKRVDQAIEDGTLPKRNAYVLSRLANKITTIFNGYKDEFKAELQAEAKPFDYKHVKNIERISEIEEPAIVICTPGFGHAGASLSLLNTWAEIEENTIIITSGYLPPDSPLKLAKEKHYIKVDGERYPVQAKIVQIELSGHADQRELVEFVKQLKPKRTLLVHGDLKAAEALSSEISPLTQVIIPRKNETITI
jgi:Cft2 family RNA processing exonuclease